ncbi:hypothetical protein D3C86_1751280 [compost metagenome]
MNIRKPVNVGKIGREIIAQPKTLLYHSLLAGYEQYSVSASCAIQGGRAGALQNRDTFYIIHIKEAQVVPPVLGYGSIGACNSGLCRGVVVDDCTVNHNQRLIVACEAVVPSDYNFR